MFGFRNTTQLRFSIFISLSLSLGIIGNLTAQSQVLVSGNIADADAAYFSAIDQYLASNPDLNWVISGDLINNCTGRSPNLNFKKSTLQLFLSTVKKHPKVSVYIVPGDRDWNQSQEDGWECVQALEKYIKDQKLPNLSWSIDDGCPGPDVVKLSESTILLLLNTQWWNHPFRKPTAADALCKYAEPEIILEEIHDAIEENLDKNILIAGHFPPQSQGRYGGEFPLSDHLKPPVIGSIKVAYRQAVGKKADIQNAQFNPFRRQLLDLSNQYQGILFLNGHEPNHQVIKLDKSYIINAGAPVKGKWAAKHKPSIFASSNAGFATLDFAEDGRVQYQFHSLSPKENSTQEVLFSSPCIASKESDLTPNPNYQPCQTNTPKKEVTPSSLTQTTVPAGPQYKAGWFKKIFLGPHYRSTWTTPINVEVLTLENYPGGLTPTKEGGGRQTKSLKLEGANKQQFVFRSVDKDPAGTLALALRNSLIADATRDQTSSQHPYGALVVADLLKPTGILHAKPKLFVMGATPRLSPFEDPFANMLGMLEIRPNKSSKTFGANDILKSHELFKLRYDDQDVKINQQEFVRARLFDILIGDWSKHEDNWKWALFKSKGDLNIRPIPRDRDHAFSNLDGLFPWIASRRWAVPNLEHFDYKIQDVRSLTFQARHMDRLLLSPVSKETYLQEARLLQEKISTSKIQEAMEVFPKEVQSISGKTIQDKLQKRIQDLEQYAEKYYAIHARYIDVVGTNKEERFSIERAADGSTSIEVIDPKGDQAGRVLYQRTFYPNETKEIRLYGLGDDDIFLLSGRAEQAIPLRIIGGPGLDEVIDDSQILKGSPRTFVYENDPNAHVDLQENSKRVDDWRDHLYYYDRKAYEYNSYFPIAFLGFNSFNGLQIGGGVSFTRRSFTRRDYSSKHSLRGSIGTLGNFSFRYNFDLHHRIHKWDVLGETAIERPSFYNFFFGLGNSSVKDDEAFRNDFNLVRLQHYHAKVGLRRYFRRRSNFHLFLGYEGNNTVDIENTILADELRVPGVGELSWAFVNPQLTLDLRDHPVYPRRGLRIIASQEWGLASDFNFGVSRLSGEYYLTPRRFPMTFGVRLGWASTQGEVPFYKLPSLGLDEGLRGYQRNRFVGSSYFYYNTEFRLPVALWKSSIIPLIVGIRGFYDSGRILNDASSKEYKHAYGGGLYLIPLARSYTISALLGFSEEETGILTLSFGTNF